jgi:hypothetical protein
VFWGWVASEIVDFEGLALSGLNSVVLGQYCLFPGSRLAICFEVEADCILKLTISDELKLKD